MIEVRALKQRFISAIALFVMYLFLTACAPGEVETLLQGLDAIPSVSSTDRQSGEPIQPLSTGIGPIELSPEPGEPGSSGNITNDQSGGNISSSGEQSSGDVSSNQPGSMESSAPGNGISGEPKPAAHWKTFQNDEYIFSISYPEDYVILPEIELLKNIDQALVYRVRFQHKNLANSAVADQELPQFSVEVYTASVDTLKAFVEDLGPGVNAEEFHLGDLTGYRVTYNRLIAPNEFYYFLGHGYIYKLTPLGEHSLEMLQSFTILP
jgi:hypothetical protein